MELKELISQTCLTSLFCYIAASLNINKQEISSLSCSRPADKLQKISYCKGNIPNSLIKN